MNETKLAKHHENNSPIPDNDDDINKKNNNNNASTTTTTTTTTQRDYKQIAKYSYVITALVIGFGLAFLKQVSSTVDEWLDSVQKDILQFLINETVLYILLVLIVLTICKSLGIKDIFGLRTIIVVILSWRITHNEGATLMLSMFIMGVLSSISKLIEYRAIGRELQYIIGKPIEYIFKYIKLFLTKILKIKPENLIWFDPKYTLEISFKSRDDLNMSIVNNFQYRCNNEESERTFSWYLNETCFYILSILWTSCIEWVQPITELFLFAHNWKLTISNVIIIICAEFSDFDKMVETWYMIQGVKDGDIIDAKIDSLVSKVYFWMAGYTIILFPTLYWAYKYHQKFIEKNDENDENDENKNDLELQQQSDIDIEANLENNTNTATK